MDNREIVAFDSWTNGIRHFDRFHSSVQAVGYKLRFLHIESWAPESGKARRPSTTGIEIVDVGSATGFRFLKLFDKKRPAVLVFVSVDSFTHRAVNLLCQKMGIPTVHLFHGIVTVQSTGSDASTRMNPIARLLFVIPRIPRLFLRVLPTYGCALFGARAGLSEWLKIPKDIIGNAIGKYSVKSAPDARCNIALVYTESDRAHAMTKYGYGYDEVFVVGNPDLETFGIQDRDIGALVHTNSPKKRELIYIDTGLILSGRVFKTPDEFVDHLKILRRAAEEQGYSVSLKLKPKLEMTGIFDTLRADGFEILDNDTFRERLLTAAAAIVEPSTASLVAGLVGLPLF
ncbi:hypothetical protein HGD85_04420, partial [Rhodobacteraceae bacterium R_SAG10]|nr:hypothetical protein [Rhodobacteraceae bacterium R_SAG10]